MKNDMKHSQQDKAMSEDQIELIIADDSNFVIECIRHWLKESDCIKLMGTVSSSGELNELVNMVDNPVVLSTYSWAMKQGKENLRRMIVQHPRVIYALSLSSSNYAAIHALLDLGFKGFIGDITTREDFIKGMCDLRKYNYFMAPEILAEFMEVKQKENTYTYADKTMLTKRETEILEYVLLGKRSKEIAKALNISKRTVDGHRANINNKFGVRNTAQLYKKAVTYLYSL